MKLKAKIEIEKELHEAGLRKLIGMGKGMVEWEKEWFKEWEREWFKEWVREWFKEWFREWVRG